MTTMTEPSTVPIWRQGPGHRRLCVTVALLAADVGTTVVDNSTLTVAADTAVEYADAELCDCRRAGDHGAAPSRSAT